MPQCVADEAVRLLTSLDMSEFTCNMHQHFQTLGDLRGCSGSSVIALTPAHALAWAPMMQAFALLAGTSSGIAGTNHSSPLETAQIQQAQEFFDKHARVVPYIVASLCS